MFELKNEKNDNSMFSMWLAFSIVVFLSVALLVSEIFWFNESMGEMLWLWYYHKGIVKTVIYLGSYLSVLLFFSAIFFIRRPFVFLFLFMSAVIPYLINISYLLINGSGFGANELQVFINNASKFSSDAWFSYSPYMIKSLLFFIGIFVLGIIIRLITIKSKNLIKTRYVLLLGFLSFLVTLSIVFKTTNTINKYPVYADFYNTMIYHFTKPTYYGERDILLKKPNYNSKYKNIIWIVDESISYNYLSINGYEKETTPYLNLIKDRYVNLGRASSLGNCSAMTNIGLMSGIQLDQLPDKASYSLKSPNIFQYAKNAGYTTHYISGQSHDDLLQNYMTRFDVKYVDEFYQPSKVYRDDKVPEEDIINAVKEAVDNNKRNFIFIVKRGAHFHWSGQAPKNKIFFKPTLSKGDALIVDNKEKSVNSYSNTIKYRVDDFFQEFFLRTKLLDDNKSFIIYTSDHGQSILEGESNGTHCDSTDPHLSQGIVPLLVFSNRDKSVLSKLPKDKFSHFEIFPTTLGLMGYQDYNNGYTFFNKPDSKQVFVSGDLFGRASFYFNDINKLEGN